MQHGHDVPTSDPEFRKASRNNIIPNTICRRTDHDCCDLDSDTTLLCLPHLAIIEEQLASGCYCLLRRCVSRYGLEFYLGFLIIMIAGGGTWTTVLIVKVKVFARKPELHWPALLWFLSAVVSDVMITVVLVITLNKRKTGFTATDDVVSKIIRTTVQTGMLTALVAIGDVIFFMTLPHTALNFIWDLALTKLYANCLLSTLNARAKLNETSGKYSNQNNVQLSSGDRRFRDFYSPTKSTSAFYELDTPQTFEGHQTCSSDIESGIRVTKVVKTKEYSNSTNRMVSSATK